MGLPEFVTLKNLLSHAPNTENSGDLRYVFIGRSSDNQNNICFSIALFNAGSRLIDRVWFSTFIGIGQVRFGPGIDEQDCFTTKVFFDQQHMSGYTKENIKLPPETMLEILYFDIPKNKLDGAGAFEFYYGCECVKKISFTASWNEGEYKNPTDDSTEKFISFIKKKNSHWKRKLSRVIKWLQTESKSRNGVAILVLITALILSGSLREYMLNILIAILQP